MNWPTLYLNWKFECQLQSEIIIRFLNKLPLFQSETMESKILNLPEEWYWSNKLPQATYPTTYAQKSKTIISKTERIWVVILAYIIRAHSVLLRILDSNKPSIFFFLQVRLSTAHCISTYQPLCCNYVSFNWLSRKMLK